jgi:hypothetical protein
VFEVHGGADLGVMGPGLTQPGLVKEPNGAGFRGRGPRERRIFGSSSLGAIIRCTTSGAIW